MNKQFKVWWKMNRNTEYLHENYSDFVRANGKALTLKQFARKLFESEYDE